MNRIQKRNISRVRHVASTFFLLLLFILLTIPPFAHGQRHHPGKKVNDASIWTRETGIVRIAPGDRAPDRYKRPRRVIRAPLLTLEFRVLKQVEDGSPIEVDPSATFYSGEQLQLRIKPNQDGYLHVIQHSEGTDGQIVFPEIRINNGRNLVRKNEEITLPSNCGEIKRDNCWFQLEPPAGREIFLIVFSREARPAILDQINLAGATVKREEITKIKESTSKRTIRPNLPLEPGGPASRYAIWATNTDPKNNEELIVKIALNHQERTDR